MEQNRRTSDLCNWFDEKLRAEHEYKLRNIRITYRRELTIEKNQEIISYYLSP